MDRGAWRVSSAIFFTACGFPSLWTHCFRSRSAGLTAATLLAGTLGSAPGLRCPAKGRWFLWPREGDPGLRGRRSRRLAALRTADSSEPAWVSFFSRSPSSRGLISRFPMPVTQGARPWAASRLAPTPHSPPRGTLGVAHLSLEGLGVFSGALSPQRIL